MPTSSKKPRQFALIMSDEDKRMIVRLSEVDQRPASLIIRELIRSEYRRRFPTETR